MVPIETAWDGKWEGGVGGWGVSVCVISVSLRSHLQNIGRRGVLALHADPSRDFGRARIDCLLSFVQHSVMH